MTTPADIERLALKNPAVKAALTHWRLGHCSYEQAMMEAVKLLAEHAETLVREVQRLHLRCPIIVEVKQ